MKLKRLSLVIVSISISLFAGLFFAEVYLRITAKLELQHRNESKEAWAGDRKFRQAEDLMLGYEYTPHESDGSWLGYKANSLGFPDKERNIVKSNTSYRICVVGDSITEDGRYVEYLENKLNKGSGSHFEVWNCGVGGYGILHYYANIRSKILNFNPDLIIISFCLNDFNCTPVIYEDQDGKLIEYSNIYGYFSVPVNRQLFLRWRIYRLALIALSRISSYFKANNHLPWQTDNISRGRWAVQNILKLTDKAGIDVKGLIIPYLKEDYTEQEQLDYSDIKTVLDESGIKYLDMHGKFEDIGSARWRRERSDRIHPSEEGHRLISDHLYDFIEKTRLTER